jgi:peptidoglycan/LPS O-acetylase OafA/YrhL
VEPFSGATVDGILFVWKESIKNLVLLLPPYAPGMFAGLHFKELNGSMWTIACEFRCYLLILLLDLLGLLRRPLPIAGMVLLLFTVLALVPGNALVVAGQRLPGSVYWLGHIDSTIRLTGVFLVGTLFYLLRDRLFFSLAGSMAASSALLFCMSFQALTEPGIAIFGGYLIFTFAGWGKTGFVRHINNEEDISYGVYLHAFPIEQLLLLRAPQLPLLATGLLTFVGACACGWLIISWHYIEKPALTSYRIGLSAVQKPSRGVG